MYKSFLLHVDSFAKVGRDLFFCMFRTSPRMVIGDSFYRQRWKALETVFVAWQLNSMNSGHLFEGGVLVSFGAMFCDTNQPNKEQMSI